MQVGEGCTKADKRDEGRKRERRVRRGERGREVTQWGKEVTGGV